MEEVRWGMIGAGSVAELKSAPAFNKVPHSRLVAIMRRDRAKAEDYARRHRVTRWYADASELIHDPEVNAIYVATPPSSHAAYAIEAMRAGKPVYVEKPMALNYRECEEMIRISEETGISLFVAYYRRSLPAFMKVSELLGEGAIGTVLTVNVTLYKQARERGLDRSAMSWHVFPEISGAGHFYDLASHQFDYLDFLFGPVSVVKGIAVNRAGLYPAEDTVTCSFRFQNGITGTGSWCFVCTSQAETDRIEIIGEEGKITLPCFQHGELLLENSLGRLAFRFENPENIQFNLISQVVRDLRGEGKCVSTGLSAARTSWVLEEVVREYYDDFTPKGNHENSN